MRKSIKWGTPKSYNFCIIISLNIFMQCYYVIDWMILKFQMHSKFSLCKHMTLKLKWAHHFFCHDWYMLMLKSHKFNAIRFALFVLTLFMIFAQTLSLSKYHAKCEMNELHSYANLLLYTLVSNTFSNILTRIAINILLRDILSRLICFISFVHIFTMINFQFQFDMPKFEELTLVLIHFLSCDKCFCWWILFMCKSCYMLDENLFLMIIE